MTIKMALYKPTEFVNEYMIGKDMTLGVNEDGTDYVLYIDGLPCGLFSPTTIGQINYAGKSLSDCSYRLKSVTTNPRTHKTNWYVDVTWEE